MATSNNVSEYDLSTFPQLSMHWEKPLDQQGQYYRGNKMFVHGLKIGFIFLIGALIQVKAFGTAKQFAFNRNFDLIEPFEKIYVSQHQILCTPAGFFLKHHNGYMEKVRAVMHDNRGMYALRVITQCPMCGRCYCGKEPEEGFCCPLYEKELVPGVWGPP